MKQSKINKKLVFISLVLLSSVSSFSDADSFLLLRSNNVNDNNNSNVSILRHGNVTSNISNPLLLHQTINPKSTTGNSRVHTDSQIIHHKKIAPIPSSVLISEIEKNKKEQKNTSVVKPISIYSTPKYYQPNNVVNVNVGVSPNSNNVEHFTMKKGITVLDNLKRWGKVAGWHIIWRVPTTWVIPSSATFNGSFKVATSEAIKSLYYSGKNIYASFFNPNNTVIITGTGDKK